MPDTVPPTAPVDTDKQTLRRVQDALYHVRKGLQPFVEGSCWVPGW